MLPRVSVIIPNYNYANYLAEAIDSVLAQTYSNIEIIVVDDGSTDNSARILENYTGKIKCIFQQNQGVSAARNNGVAQSSGELLAFLDADDVWLPTKVEEQVRVFIENPKIGIVHTGYVTVGADGAEIQEFNDGGSGRLVKEFLLFEEPTILAGCSGAIVKRTLFNEVLGFDRALMTAADWDLFRRVATKCIVGFCPKILLRYRLHGSNMHGNIRRMEREMIYGFSKAFAEPNFELSKIKGRSYGNLYRVLSGSYFQAGEYGAFLRCAVKSIWHRPAGLGYFAAFPFRRLKRR